MSNKKNKHTIEYYMGLPYTIHIEDKKDEDGHFFYAFISELGKYTCYGVGKSMDEAVKSLKSAQEVTIVDILEAGKEVPLPREEALFLPSGKFVVRTSRRLHAQLVEQAKEEGISLNLLVNELLAQNIILRMREKEEEKQDKARTNENERPEDKPIRIDPNVVEKEIERKVRFAKNTGAFKGIVRKGYYKRVS